MQLTSYACGFSIYQQIFYVEQPFYDQEPGILKTIGDDDRIDFRNHHVI